MHHISLLLYKEITLLLEGESEGIHKRGTHSVPHLTEASELKGEEYYR